MVVQPNLPAIAVAAGRTHTCAIANNRTVWCWGGNDYGQLGTGQASSAASPDPVQVLNITNAAAISSWNDHTCVTTTVGTVLCWGYGAHGELGNNAQGGSATPVTVSGITSGATGIAVGWSHACAIVSGALRCWGENGSGQLGDSGNEDSYVPVNVSGLTAGVTHVSAGRSGTCAIVSGAVRCWGANYDGKVGNNGGGATYLSPQTASGLTTGNTRAGNGYFHSCAVTSAGVSCWGNTTEGQVGNGMSGISSNPVLSPYAIPQTTGATEVGTGFYFSCAVISGAAKCWGYDIGANSGNTTTPTTKTGLSSGVTAITTGTQHACALLSNGQIRCWGENEFGELGNDSTTWSTAPVTVRGFQ